MRREWLVALISEVHTDSSGAYGDWRIRAELVEGRGIPASLGLVTPLTHDAAISALPGLAGVKRIKGTPTSDDLIERKFARSRLDELWVTGITEHRIRGGKVCCCRVMDTCGRQIVGWSIDSMQDARLVATALNKGVKERSAKRGSIVHADYGVEFTFLAFTDTVHLAGLTPSFGWVGDAFDNAMTETSRPTMPIESLDRT